ncbi:MAG: TerB family tellurite resistance protein [Clostridia bacterium]|nr:TerB family tellurite resistance protein [Clostridia bacterium]
MKEFNMLCKEVENLNVIEYGAILAAKSAKVLPVLNEIGGSKIDGAAIFAQFILGAIAADGRLSEEEYLIVYPLLHTFFGDELDYRACKAAVRFLRPESRELKKALDDMVDLFGLFDEELKDDLIFICLLICAVDGKVSLKEKNWIKKLIA